MSHKFIEVVTDYPTTEEAYSLLLQVEQIVEIRPEVEAEGEPRHEPVAVVTLTTGEMLILKTPYRSLVRQLEQANMVFRPSNA